MKKQLVIFGAGDIAELAHYYFSSDSSYEVAAFTIDDEYATISEFCGLPVVPFSQIEQLYPPSTYDLFIAMGYSHLNKARADKYEIAKQLGYHLPSYISSRTTVFSTCKIGDNCLILEDCTIQPFVSIGNNVVIWSGSNICHHTSILDHCFMSSHVAIAGRTIIEEFCFIGINATIRDHVTVGSRCVIGAGTLILSDTRPGSVYIGNSSRPSEISSDQLREI